MVGYYLKTAAKTLGKYKFHSAVSLISLTLGFICFIAANVEAGYLLSWDRHFPDSERIFTVNSSAPDPRNDGLPFVPSHLAAYLESEFSEIELTTTERPSAEYNVSIDNNTERMRVRFVEGDFLQIFPLPLLSPGNRLSALGPNTALIMESAALARFGTTEVQGRRLVIGQRLELTIGGVVRTMTRPNHLQSITGDGTDLIAPMRVFEQLASVGTDRTENWHDRSYQTYVKFAADAPLDMQEYGQRLIRFSERYVPITYYTSGPHHTIFSFHPLEENGPSLFKLVFGDVDVTRLLIFAGFLVLLVACLNYSNLVIAQLTQRSHEITVQKVIGAKRRQLMAQYSLESLLVAGLAFLIALAVCSFILTNVDALRARGFHPSLLLTPGFWLISLGGLFVIVAIAGAYPALRVTKHSLTGMLRPAGSIGYSHRLRSLMVGTQFAFSGALLILAIFIFNQNSTMVFQASNEDLTPVLILSGLLPETENELDSLEAALRRSDSVESTTRSKRVPWELGAEAIPLWRAPDPLTPFVALNRIAVGHDYFATMDMPLLAGRTFSEDYAADLYPSPREIPSAQGPYSVVIDERTAARLGWSSPEQAVGEPLYTSYLPPVVQEPRFVSLTVVGVVGYRALEIAAVGYAPTHVFTLSPSESNNLIVRPDASAIPEVLSHIDEVWSRFYPRARARPEFLDDVFARSYGIVAGFGNVFAALALFSFVISSIGLIGMATFIIRLRQREVGIRKILGANKRRVLRMLLMDFSKPVLIANLVAWPLGFGLASAYLSIFYVRTPVTMAPFLLSLALTLGVAILAVVYQARGSSSVRPAAVLKYE
jgi:putative ABC transport system permease protein